MIPPSCYKKILLGNWALRTIREVSPQVIDPKEIMTDETLTSWYLQMLQSIPTETLINIDSFGLSPLDLSDLSLDQVRHLFTQVWKGDLSANHLQGFYIEPFAYDEEAVISMYYSAGDKIPPDSLVLLLNSYGNEETYPEESLAGMDEPLNALLALTLSPFIVRPILRYGEEDLDARPLAYLAAYWYDLLGNPLIGVLESHEDRTFVEWQHAHLFDEMSDQATRIYDILEWVDVNSPHACVEAVIKENIMEVP